MSLRKLFFIFTSITLGLLGGFLNLLADEPATSLAPVGGEFFSQLFTEKLLTVTREGDGILPGTLRTALIQASGIRSQNSFTLVKIVFNPSLKRVRVTKGALPEVDGSLTTIDCQTPAGRVLIEGAQENHEGENEPFAGLQLTSNRNTVRNCHITGFKGPGILIRGNRNVVELNTLGYHKDSPETAIEKSPRYEEPKTNEATAIVIDSGANENLIQNNEMIANAMGGVQLNQGVGTGNKITFNLFAKNGGKPIKSQTQNNTLKPQITKITQQGDYFIVSGIAQAGAEIQLYVSGKDENEIGMNIIPGMISPSENFTLATKSKGFIPNQTHIIALTHDRNHNTSEFSSPLLLPLPGVSSTLFSTQEADIEKSKFEPKEEMKKVILPNSTDDNIEEIPANEPATAPETVINIQGL